MASCTGYFAAIRKRRSSMSICASRPLRRGLLMVVGAVVVSSGSASSLRADIIAVTPNITTGTQIFDSVFGLDCNVASPTGVTIPQLGVFDNAGDGVLLTDSPTQPIVIQVWNRGTGLAVASMNFGGG